MLGLIPILFRMCQMISCGTEPNASARSKKATFICFLFTLLSLKQSMFSLVCGSFFSMKDSELVVKITDNPVVEFKQTVHFLSVPMSHFGHWQTIVSFHLDLIFSLAVEFGSR